MKKLILLVLLVSAVTFSVSSCKKKDKEAPKTEEAASDQAKEEAKEVMASNDVLYQCPMDCEEGKSYTEKGSCPVCKMDLREKKVDLEEGDHKDGDGHQHEKDSVH